MCEKDFSTMKKFVCLALVVLLLSGCTSQGGDQESADEPVEITFIANCGFLIESSNIKILVDALWRNDLLYNNYSISEETLELMENGEPPFDGVDLVLATHAHWDHFHAEAVGKHLENNPHAVFISTDLAVDELKIAFPNLDGMQERVIGVQPEEGERILITANGIDVEVLNLPHGLNPMRNNGYIFTVEGVKILYTGDFAGLYYEAEDYQLPNEGIDIAFVPYLFLQGAWEYIQAKYVIPMHFTDPSPENPQVKQIEASFSNAIMFYEPMQTVNMDVSGVSGKRITILKA